MKRPPNGSRRRGGESTADGGNPHHRAARGTAEWRRQSETTPRLPPPVNPVNSVNPVLTPPCPTDAPTPVAVTCAAQSATLALKTTRNKTHHNHKKGNADPTGTEIERETGGAKLATVSLLSSTRLDAGESGHLIEYYFETVYEEGGVYFAEQDAIVAVWDPATPIGALDPQHAYGSGEGLPHYRDFTNSQAVNEYLGRIIAFRTGSIKRRKRDYRL